MSKLSQKIAIPAMALALTAFGAVPAMSAALNILASGVHAGNQSGTTTNVNVAINGAATSLSFKTTKAATPIYANFNAECGAEAPGTGWVTVILFIDGIAMPPGSTARALCTAESATVYHWVSAELAAIASVGPGTHTLTAQVSRQNGATSWWLGDIAVIVGKF